MENAVSASSRSNGHPPLRVVIPPHHLGEQLYFHEKCGKKVVLSNGGLTAHRKDPYDETYHGVVFTHRTLFDNELFEVTVDEIIKKWPGYSFGIGVTLENPATIHDPDEDSLQWLHDSLSSCWYMYGNSVYENGNNEMEEYGMDIGKIEEGDRVGVMKKDNGALHFFLNEVDMGPSVAEVSGDVYGVIDLGGCSVRATIVDSLTPVSR